MKSLNGKFTHRYTYAALNGILRRGHDSRSARVDTVYDRDCHGIGITLEAREVVKGGCLADGATPTIRKGGW